MKRSALFQIFLTAIALVLLFAPLAGAQVHQYLMGTGPSGGTYYALGAAISKVASQYAEGINITVQSTGGITENCRLLGTNKVEFGLASGGISFYAYEGKEMFSTAYRNIRAIGFIYLDVVQIIVMADSNIYSLQDMKGKRSSLGSPGSGSLVTARLLYESAGMSFKDFTPMMLPPAQAADRMKDRQLDAMQTFAAVPTATILDLSTMHKIRLVEIKGDFRKRFQEKYPFYISVTIPAGSYRGVDKDVETIGDASSLYVREDIPADAVYKITKAIYEHAEEIGQIHTAAKQIKLKDAAKGILIPFHEGAIKYFKEKGIQVKQ
jgi:TRAP transporter TAXI family solute receptor